MKDSYGYTSLHVACNYGKIEMVQLLIKHQLTFDASSNTNKGWTIQILKLQSLCWTNLGLKISEVILDGQCFTFKSQKIKGQKDKIFRSVLVPETNNSHVHLSNKTTSQ